MNLVERKVPSPEVSVTQELRPVDVLRWLYRHKIAFGVATICAAVVAALVSLMIPRSYQAVTVLRPVITDSTTSSAANAFGGALGGIASAVLRGGHPIADDASVTLAYMQSMDFVRYFITSENLLPEFYPDKWDADKKAWIGPPPSLDKAAERFRNNVVTVEQNPNGLVELRVTWSHSEKAQQLAERFIARINEKRRERALYQATANLDYLNRRLQRETVFEMRTVLSDLAGKEVRRIMLAEGPAEFALETVSPPYASPYPVAPARKLITLVGAIFGFAVTALFLLLRQALRNTA